MAENIDPNIPLLVENIRNYHIDNITNVRYPVSVPDFNIALLNKRLHEARNAFLVLYDKGMGLDAELIAGHIMEICAMIYYIKSGPDKLLNSRKGIARSAASCVYDILSLSDFVSKSDKYDGLLEEVLSYLDDTGHLIIKETSVQDKKDFNKHQLAKLRNKELTNKEKRDLLKKHYELPQVTDYLNCFISGTVKKAKSCGYPNFGIYQEAFRLFYMSYCRVKHATPFMYTSVPGENDISIVDDSMGIVVQAVFLCMEMVVKNPVYFK